jgi:putative ABC transport system permease protein
MKTPLAWRNLLQSKVRSLIALCGISFAILLIFMQLGFYGAAGSSATQVYDALDFDLLVLSTQYVFIARPAQFPRDRLEQIRAVEGVVSATPVWLAVGDWRNPETQEEWHNLTLGVEPKQPPFRDQTLNDQLPLLMIPDNALVDALSRPQHGHLAPGITSEMNHHRIRIVGRYSIGAGFVAGGTIVTSRDTFIKIFQGTSPDQPNAGLVKLTPGISARATAEEMKKHLWPVATAVTRSELATPERRYWLKVKPIGIMFTSGVLVAFVAGAVILYQVLASEVQNRMREYATLKALGYDTGFIYGVVVRQALIFSGLGFVPAFVFALGLYFLLRTQAMVPVAMGWSRVAGVFLLTAMMCLSATFLAIRKLREADPADLF